MNLNRFLRNIQWKCVGFCFSSLSSWSRTFALIVYRALVSICDYKNKMTTVLNSFTTALHPCAIETLSLSGDENLNDTLVVCGCYELDESSQHRNGSIVFYRCQYDNDNQGNDTFTAREYASPITCPAGVLDLKVTRKFICTALASETLQLYSVDAVLENQPTINEPIFHANKEGEGLYLSVDCLMSSDGDSQDPQKFAVSTQSGSIVVYDLTASGLVEEAHIPSAHVMFGENMPAWMVAWNHHSKNDLISGGDDCAFRLWDIRCCETPQLTNKKHTAGVTSAKFHETNTNLLLTGSYDESCMFWDIRSLRNPLATIETGGGVWRTKWITPQNSKDGYLATANMQGGCNIYRIDLSNMDSIEVLDRIHYTDHKEKHLSYGLGIVGISLKKLGTDPSMRVLSSSCSFYDSTVDFWSSSLPYVPLG